MIYEILAIASILLFAYILNLVRAKKISENQSLLWLLLPIGIFVSVFFREQLDFIAHTLGVDYSPAFYLLAAIIFILVLILNLTIIVYRNSERTKKLTQELALMENKPNNEAKK